MPILRPRELVTIVRRLADGLVVGIPTDTVYGLAALATSEGAVRRLTELKGRDSDQPIAVLFDELGDITPHLAQPGSLGPVAPHWPGALTAVVRAHPDSELVPPVVAAGGTIGIRQPDDPLARRLLRQMGGLLAVSSANRHGQLPGLTAAAVSSAFGGELWVLDGGARPGGVASTVVDLTSDPPQVLRRGAIGATELGAVEAGS